MNLSIGNRKIIKNKLNTATFGLQAIKTCPGKGECQKECFATVGNYNFPVVKNKQEERLKASKKKNFVKTISEEIVELNVGAVRIHDSGDYYSDKYLQKWIEIAEQNPKVIFYSYTKSVHFFKKDYNTWKVSLPSNFVTTFSYGGKYDHLINPTKDKHALVFLSLEELLDYKYSDTSKLDDNAYDPDIKRVGLIAKKNRKRIGWGKTLADVTSKIAA
jgi:hypothetical protein